MGAFAALSLNGLLMLQNPAWLRACFPLSSNHTLSQGSNRRELRGSLVFEMLVSTADPNACEVQMIHPKAVARARKGMPSDEHVAVAAELLKAIADPTRMRILAALQATDELCVCDIAAAVGMSESAVSHQLRVLRSLNLVTPRKESRQVFYRLADDHVTSILRCALEHAQE